MFTRFQSLNWFSRSAPLAEAPPAPAMPAARWWNPDRLRGSASFTVSLTLHTALLLLLALFTIGPERTHHDGRPLLVTLERAPQPSDPLETPAFIAEPRLRASAAHFAAIDTRALDVPAIVAPHQSQQPPALVAQPRTAVDTVHPLPWLLQSQAPSGGGLEGRTGQLRGELVATRGGSPGSEDAVRAALAWIVAHQHKDGSWRFDLESAPCEGRCTHSGTNGSATAATGLALLPLLGAGQTHQQGEYQEAVNLGLYYLLDHMIVNRHGGDLQQGTMYAQGIATIALCEAYAMTQDPALKAPAQRAVDFICYAQHPAGGWRYYPGQPGDMTVFGWQFMALKSAQLGGLHVPSPVTERARSFLNSMQTDDGAAYGYLEPGKQPVPTAVGLLSRMYFGWPHDDERLARGAAWLAETGPSRHDMYFNYYATQTLHHYDGPLWSAWNGKLRDYLIRTQSHAGHEAGSWFFDDEHGQVGGRLYTTAICAMTLEVYYRHMPLYGRRSVEFGF